MAFQNEIAKLGIPEKELSTVNSDIDATIKEAKKDNPDITKIATRFKAALDTTDEVDDTVEKVSKWKLTKWILGILII